MDEHSWERAHRVPPRTRPPSHETTVLADGLMDRHLTLPMRTLSGGPQDDHRLERPASPLTRGVLSLHSSDLMLLLAVGLWAFGLSRVSAVRLGPYGLPPDLPILVYAGFAVFLISATCELSRARLSSLRMAVHAAALVVMLYGIAPLVYYEGRYEWLYKTVGVVQYINAHGRLNPSIDIYQNWPGFFAFAAWLDRVAGVGSPLAYAKWAQVAFELGALPLLYLIYSALGLSLRQRWVAILLYSASNWIGQDYFSPQALGTILSLGIMAIALRWLYPVAHTGEPATVSLPIRHKDRFLMGRTSAKTEGQRFGPRAAAVIVIIAIFSVLTFTHQISPYMLAEQLGTLALIRLLRPRWLPFLLAAIAVAYLIPHYSFVSSHYGVTSSIGHFFTNIKPPSFSAPNVSPAQKFIQTCAEALSIGVWALAGLGAWLNRRTGRAILGTLLLAYSPVLVLVMGSYGNEGILRVYLFSLTWSAALAAMALAPTTRAASAPNRSAFVRIFRLLQKVPRSTAHMLRVPIGWRRPGVLRIPVTLAIILALFFPSFFGDDAFNYMTRAEVNETAAFWLHAQPGHVFLPLDAVPIADTWRYNLFSWSPIFGSTLYQSSVPPTYSIAEQLAQKADAKTHGHEPAYVIITPNMVAYNNAYGITSPASFFILLDSLRRSHSWKLVLNRAGVIIFELPPRRQNQVGTIIP